MANISRDQTVQYIVTMIDDILQVVTSSAVALAIFSVLISSFYLCFVSISSNSFSVFGDKSQKLNCTLTHDESEFF